MRRWSGIGAFVVASEFLARSRAELPSAYPPEGNDAEVAAHEALPPGADTSVAAQGRKRREQPVGVGNQLPPSTFLSAEEPRKGRSGGLENPVVASYPNAIITPCSRRGTGGSGSPS